MKGFIIAIICFISSSFNPTLEEATVYVCMGKYSKKYHYNSSCAGLSNCSTKIYKLPISEARDMGRTLCGREK